MRATKVLFLCTENAARSQMAERLLAEHGGDEFEVYSAGYAPAEEIHPNTLQVMEEAGLDLDGQFPKGLKTYLGRMGFNYAIIVCDRGEEGCPKTFPGVGTVLLWPFEDPRGKDVPDEEMLEAFRRVRDELDQRIRHWLDHPDEELRKLMEQRYHEHELRVEGFAEHSPTTSAFSDTSPASGDATEEHEPTG